jgi:hypothetical protein
LEDKGPLIGQAIYDQRKTFEKNEGEKKEKNVSIQVTGGRRFLSRVDNLKEQVQFQNNQT